MTYDEFLDEIDAAELTVKEFAHLIKRTPNAITNYASKGEVPAHLAIIATLIAEMHFRKIDYRSVIADIEFHGMTPRKGGAKGFRGKPKSDAQESDPTNDEVVLLIVEDDMACKGDDPSL